ncbi:MAG: ferritin [Proteobacteria bacterium]|nr:ferritin [Pseudomonadota bacterium]
MDGIGNFRRYRLADIDALAFRGQHRMQRRKRDSQFFHRGKHGISHGGALRFRCLFKILDPPPSFNSPCMRCTHANALHFARLACLTPYELNGAQEYLSLASNFYAINLNGFGSWYTAQYVEELNHARMMMFFLTDKDETPAIGGIDVPTITFSTPLDAASKSLVLEEIQTERINKLHDLATAMNSRDAATFLLFFITEQVQEEANFKNQVDRLILAGDDRAALLALDKDAGARIIPPFFMPPPAP